MSDEPVYDLLVIGGGINGVGIARDAAGRGLSVLLCEQDDLGHHTSSASTKLVHGGLRYLEYYEFGLVRKSLQEREVLLRAAPHIIKPLRFVMPHSKGLRPAWMIRAGLFLYDHLGKRELLPGSRAIDLRKHVAGAPLRTDLTKGFVYSDAWVDDARLVVLTALDAAERGAVVLPRTRCVSARRGAASWEATLQPASGGPARIVKARALVNAAGPWAVSLLLEALSITPRRHLRMVKGSHIVVPKMFDHDHAYILQNPDKRITFAIPYERDFTLVGTTDMEYEGDPAKAAISTKEIAYLCEMANLYFVRKIAPTDVVWSYSGVRPLIEDESADLSAVTRDYELEYDAAPERAPLLSVFGGKLTTYRKLAEEVMDLLARGLGNVGPAWTAGVSLPGGDIADADFEGYLAKLRARVPWLPEELARRYAHAYGTRVDRLLGSARSVADLGEPFGGGLYEAEVEYLVNHEWATTAEDILWRRSKLGLRTDAEASRRLAARLAEVGRTHSPLEIRNDGRPQSAMNLTLQNIDLRVGAEPYLRDVNLALVPGAVNVLLGPTQAGKTSLMRIIAGLDRPTSGRVLIDGKDVTGVSVRKRNVAMVYQQFVNYPSFTVFDNIAEPLRLSRRFTKEEIDRKVHASAEMMHIDHLLDRLPAALSGGQQQRTAIARALVKEAQLLLLDEPLVNLDYKLREELRDEMRELFAGGHTTVVYATTEPLEALMLGGQTAVLDQGRVLQVGPTLAVYHHPETEHVAEVFSDPPINILPARLEAGVCRLSDTAAFDAPAHMRDLPAGPYRIGIRANHVDIDASRPGSAAIPSTVELAEISGSETFVHARHGELTLVARFTGVHEYQLAAPVTLYFDPARLFVFDTAGRLVAHERRAA